MDFMRNDRVSCLEFQEVVSGQIRHCSFGEAKQIFCHLTRGCDGWLRLGDLVENLYDVNQEGLESGCSSVIGNSGSALGSAADVLRSLILGKDTSEQDALGYEQQASGKAVDS